MAQNKEKADSTDLKRIIKYLPKKNGVIHKTIKDAIFVKDSASLKFRSYSYNILYFEKYEGKEIRNIQIVVLDPFGNSVDHPETYRKSFLNDVGNKTHSKTMDWVVRNGLFFDEKDSVNSIKLAESERLLRGSPFIFDARIKVVPFGDQVDIIVYVQDVWSKGGTISSEPKYVEVEDINFLGAGGRFATRVNLNNDNTVVNPGFFYRNEHIRKGYLVGEVFYDKLEFSQTANLSLERPFFSPVIHWAGGAGIIWGDDVINKFEGNRIVERQGLTFYESEIWGGYATSFKKNKKSGDAYYAAGVSFIKNDYLKTPAIDTLNEFQESNTILASVGISQSRFFQDRYVYALGRQEDILAGTLIKLTLGRQRRKTESRIYYAIESGRAYNLKKYGYLFLRGSVGAFYHDNSWSNGVLDLHSALIGRLRHIKKFGLRNYLRISYSAYFNKTNPKLILDINDVNGISGINYITPDRENTLMGDKRFTINYGLNAFPPYKLLGFKSAFLIQIDLAWIHSADQYIFSGVPYQGYGVGIKFRNAHLIFPTSQISFNYYPQAEEFGKSSYTIIFKTSGFFTNQELRFTKPSILTL